MQKIFDDMLHQHVECYVDDLVVKSKEKENHLQDLRLVFERLRRFQLKMNPLKCAFGVSSGKFLGFIVRHRGIEIDQSKIEAILKMPEPRNIHELKSLQGKLAYIRRFISNLAGRCQPFTHLMKKDMSFYWDEACTNAFNKIKQYLLNHLSFKHRYRDAHLSSILQHKYVPWGCCWRNKMMKARKALSTTLVGH
jgi:hypothetical protein